MNNRDREMLRKMMQASLYMSVSTELQKINTQTNIAEMFEGTNERRRYLEHHPSIKTVVTDKDMLLLHIDMTLDSGDAELFMQLTDELKGMEVMA